MAAMSVRNIDGYNKKLSSFGDHKPEEFAGFEPMPYLVIIIDELADLMLIARKEVETSIVRLAQLARAAGIHMIIATQRPSVDVVTGLIKANFPSRIAFTVTSPQDSRTILDTVGANHLLGKGDMLFKPGGGKNKRLHGTWITEEEIGKVIDFWKAQHPPKFELDLEEWASEEARGNGPSGNGGDLADDPEYRQAVQFVMEQGKASISLIQRRFRIGFNKAARYIEQMEADGVIGPQDGSKPRQVLRSE
jgi:S-DNA-T family DNA segregation ATPase FtsK/SpoIIIE